MAACLMAYNGWSYVSFVAGEVREPQKNLVRSLVLGMATVGVLYVSANVAYLKVMTVAQIAATDRVGADLAARVLGPIGGTFVSITVLLSIIGAVNGCILTGARIPFAQARDNLFFVRFGAVHPRFQTPCLLPLPGRSAESTACSPCERDRAPRDQRRLSCDWPSPIATCRCSCILSKPC